uniref:Zinc finger protein ZFPM1/2 PR domain-containing protein n=1 Tax=Dromaius novaehollandiae TaxID=8790 RepID=A0A8C4JJ22_DRONO
MGPEVSKQGDPMSPSRVCRCREVPSRCPCLSADELELAVLAGESRVRARRSLPEGFSWGPFQGSIHSEPASPGQNETVRIWLPISRLAPCVQTPGTG